MEEKHPNLIVARKDYTPFPINAIGLFKPKDLYLLAGIYLSSEYYSDASYLYTNITVNQLSALTGVSEDYISNNFYPRLKRSGFIRYRCIQEQLLVRRNHFIYQIQLITLDLSERNFSLIEPFLLKRKV